MTETERITRYINGRILIEAGRVITSTFPNQTVYLTGAQVELLRNVTGYLYRLTSFVSEYQDSYYLVPDSAEWDAIQDIVADLEDKLMVPDNVIFGYNSELWIDLGAEQGAGSVTLVTSDYVPAGELWQIDLITAYNSVRGLTYVQFMVNDGTTTWIIKTAPQVDQNTPVVYDKPLLLAPGRRIHIILNGSQTGDDLYVLIHGYKMVTE